MFCTLNGTNPVGHSPQTCLGIRHPAAPQGIPRRRADDLAGCRTRPSPSAARSLHAHQLRPFSLQRPSCTAGSISSVRPVNRPYRSDDAPPSFVAGKRNTSRLSILIMVSRPAECACLMRRNPASVSSINPSSWTTKSRLGSRTSRSMGEDAGTRDGALGASLAGLERWGLDRRVKSASS